MNSECKKEYVYLERSYLKSHTKVFKHIQLLYKFYRKRNAKQCHKETGVSHPTCIKYFDFYKRCMNEYMQDHFYPQFKFDVDLAIDWDEAASSAKQKNHEGRCRDPVWVLGGVQREKIWFYQKLLMDGMQMLFNQ